MLQTTQFVDAVYSYAGARMDSPSGINLLGSQDLSTHYESIGVSVAQMIAPHKA